MSSEHGNLDNDTGDDLSGASFDYADASEDETEEATISQALPRADITARARLEALREQRALRKAIFDDLYYDDDLGDD